MKLPAGEDGTKLYFPTYQICTEGSNEWIEIPSANQTNLSSPAPVITLFKNNTLLKADSILNNSAINLTVTTTSDTADPLVYSAFTYVIAAASLCVGTIVSRI